MSNTERYTLPPGPTPYKPVNRSGLTPLGKAILVEPYEPEIKRGSIVIPETVSERTMQVEMRATVLAVGPAAWNDEPEARAKPGDKVLVAKYAGVIVKGTADGKLYRVCNANDVFLRIDSEKMPSVAEAA